MLNNILKEVECRVQSKSTDIINIVYDNLIKNHNDFCGCNYCEILEEYIALNKYSYSLLKALENPDYNVMDLLTDGVFKEVIRYRDLECKILTLKDRKDKLKELIIIKNK